MPIRQQGTSQGLRLPAPFEAHGQTNEETLLDGPVLVPAYYCWSLPNMVTSNGAQGSGFGTTAGPFRARLRCRLQYREIAGVNVRYAHAGSPDNPTLILLNPLPQSIVGVRADLGGNLRHSSICMPTTFPALAVGEGGVEFMTFAAQGQFLCDFNCGIRDRKTSSSSVQILECPRRYIMSPISRTKSKA